MHMNVNMCPTDFCFFFFGFCMFVFVGKVQLEGEAKAQQKPQSFKSKVIRSLNIRNLFI